MEGSKLPGLEPNGKSFDLPLSVPTYHVHHLRGVWEYPTCLLMASGSRGGTPNWGHMGSGHP